MRKLVLLLLQFGLLKLGLCTPYPSRYPPCRYLNEYFPFKSASGENVTAAGGQCVQSSFLGIISPLTHTRYVLSKCCYEKFIPVFAMRTHFCPIVRDMKS